MSLCLLALAGTPLLAQAPAAKLADTDPEAIQLDPFVVTTDVNDGYFSKSSTAAGRVARNDWQSTEYQVYNTNADAAKLAIWVDNPNPKNFTGSINWQDFRSQRGGRSAIHLGKMDVLGGSASEFQLHGSLPPYRTQARRQSEVNALRDGFECQGLGRFTSNTITLTEWAGSTTLSVLPESPGVRVSSVVMGSLWMRAEGEPFSRCQVAVAAVPQDPGSVMLRGAS